MQFQNFDSPPNRPEGGVCFWCGYEFGPDTEQFHLRSENHWKYWIGRQRSDRQITRPPRRQSFRPLSPELRRIENGWKLPKLSEAYAADKQAVVSAIYSLYVSLFSWIVTDMRLIAYHYGPHVRGLRPQWLHLPTFQGGFSPKPAFASLIFGIMFIFHMTTMSQNQQINIKISRTVDSAVVQRQSVESVESSVPVINAPNVHQRRELNSSDEEVLERPRPNKKKAEVRKLPEIPNDLPVVIPSAQIVRPYGQELVPPPLRSEPSSEQDPPPKDPGEAESQEEGPLPAIILFAKL